MKITTKTTKEQLKNILGANVKAVKSQDKNLYDRIAYADKVAKTDDSKVTRKDLVDLVKDVMKLLGDKFIEPAFAQENDLTPVEPVAENSVKKLGKGVSKKQEVNEAKAEMEAEAKAVQSEEKAEKSAKKSLGGKKTPKKDGVTALEGSENKKTVQMAKMFPKTLEVGEGDDKINLELAEDIKTFEDLYNALSKDEDIVFAYYWTKRHLKQFPYFGGWLGQPQSFENDLDLAGVIYVSEENTVSYMVSRYTEAVYTILPSDFEEVDGIRVAGGIEFQIYRAV